MNLYLYVGKYAERERDPTLRDSKKQLVVSVFYLYAFLIVAFAIAVAHFASVSGRAIRGGHRDKGSASRLFRFSKANDVRRQEQSLRSSWMYVCIDILRAWVCTDPV